MGISTNFSDITKIEMTSTELVQFWSGTEVQFVVSVKGNVQSSPDRTYIVVTDEDGKTHNAYIYDLTSIVHGGTTQAYAQYSRLAGALTDEVIGIKVNAVMEYLTENIFKGCCSSGSDGATMLYRVYVDGVLQDEFAAFSTEDQTINIIWD